MLRVEHKGIPQALRLIRNLSEFYKSDELRRILEEVMNSMVKSAKQRAPSETGNLRGSIRGKIWGWGGPQPRIVLEADASELRPEGEHFYAEAVEKGSRDHPIDARNSAWLIFFWEKKGVLFKGKHVDHPGNEAQPFLKPAVEKFTPRLKLRIESAIKQMGEGNK